MSDGASPQEGSSASQGTRLHYLDWLRVLAILMVFCFHAVHPFDFSDWQVKNADQSELLTVILVLLGLWGMPFFFLVAGAGSCLALQRRTARQYLSERFNRLFIPFVVGTILFYPIQFYCETMNRIQRGLQDEFPGILSFLGAFDPTILGWPGFSPKWLALGYHLWFLGFLFAFAVFTLPLFLWLKQEPGQRALASVARWCAHRGGLLVFALPAAALGCLLEPLFPEQHDWADFIVRMFFFALGYVLYADGRLTRAVRRDGPLLLVTGTLLVLALITGYAMELPLQEWGETPGIPQFYLMQLAVAAIAVCFSLGMLYVGMRHLDFTNRWLRYGQEAALPFFVLHQPVIIVIAFFVVQWDVGLWVKLAVVVQSSFWVTIGLYECLVRRIRPLRLAFGMKARAPDGT